MKGITYYPNENKDNILQENLKSLEIKNLTSSYNFEDKWKELIGIEYGDRYFIVSQNMHEFTEKMINEIKKGETKIEDFLYNYPKLFDLFSCCAYLDNTYKNLQLNDLDDHFLTKVLDNVVLSGVNIEEFKMVVLGSNLLNIDAMLGQSDDSDTLKSKYKFTKKVINLIDMYKNFTPYNYYFRKVDQLIDKYSKTDEENLIKIRDSFDKNMLENFAQSRIKNCILKGLFDVRLHGDLTIQRLMKAPILKEFFSKRDNENYGNDLAEMFKYQIEDKGLFLIDDVCKGNYSDAAMKNLIDVFKSEDLIEEKDYLEYKRTKVALNYLNNYIENEQC